MNEEKLEFTDNIEFSKDWITKEIIKTDFEERQKHQEVIVKIRKKELLKLVLDFVKLNERGSL